MPKTLETSVIYLVHPDHGEREELSTLIARHGFSVREFPSADAFLNEHSNGGKGCLILDLPGPGAYEVLERLRADAPALSAIVIAEGGDVSAAVRAMRAGASAFLEKPYAHSAPLREIRRLFA